MKMNFAVGGDDTSPDADSSVALPYRAKYDSEKERFAQNHPDAPPIQCHRHGMLMATKMLVKHLWCAWNNRPVHANIHDDEAAFFGRAV